MRVNIFSISQEGEKKLVAFSTGTYALTGIQGLVKSVSADFDAPLEDFKEYMK